MYDRQEKGSGAAIRIRELAFIFARRKWWFAGVFVVILLAGSLFTFLKEPVYKTYSVIELKGVYYDDSLYKYYPEEAGSLGILAPVMESAGYESGILSDIAKGFREEVFLDKVSQGLGPDISSEELSSSFNILIDSGNRVIRLETFYDTADGSYDINRALLDSFLDERRDSRSGLIDSLIESLESEIADLSGNGGSRDSRIISELSAISYNLGKNREVFAGDLEISREPEKPADAENAGRARTMVLVLFVSLAAAVIAVYLPGVFRP
jgi:hypothetical protein